MAFAEGIWNETGGSHWLVAGVEGIRTAGPLASRAKVAEARIVSRSLTDGSEGRPLARVSASVIFKINRRWNHEAVLFPVTQSAEGQARAA
jgi:hypothetical protein